MQELQTLQLTMALAFVVAGVSVAIMPYVMRKNIQFGVMLPERGSAHLTIQTYKKQFASFNIVASLLGAGSMFLSSDFTFITFGGTIMIIAFMILSYLLYYYFHRKVKVLKQQQFSAVETKADARIMVSTNFRSTDKPVVVSNWWLVTIGMIIVLATAIIPFMLYDQIPEQVPVNFGFDGEVTRWAERSLQLFLVMPLMQLVMLSIFLVSNLSYKRAKQNIKPKNPKASVEQSRAYRYAWSKYMAWVGIVTLLLLGYAQYSMLIGAIHQSFMGITLIGTVAIVGGQFYIIFKYGQGGERYKVKAEEVQETTHEMVDDDHYWIAGMFYYNPTDPAVFVEKRFGIGMTCNFARWQTWILGVGVILAIIVTSVLPIFMM